MVVWLVHCASVPAQETPEANISNTVVLRYATVQSLKSLTKVQAAVANEREVSLCRDMANEQNYIPY